MVDLEDLVDAVDDIEDIVEELTDPAEFLEDLVENPLLVVLALGAAAAAVVTVLLVLATLLFLVFAVGPVAVLVTLAVLGLFVTMLAVSGFVYLRTDIPARVQRKIDAAKERSDTSRKEGAAMSEEEAIEELKTQYAEGRLTDAELEDALEAVFTSDTPERVVERNR
ncbi:hypothetical protein [Haloarchaeobius amylolyticus]|uniref:hypothetical protein n=1 Tax=Haloarchaeobius amylolyticus TaxID=1198296 RepID=UPI0022713246|nr:hypothetical protein [Haloarchaeobius amylolyticus]